MLKKEFRLCLLIGIGFVVENAILRLLLGGLPWECPYIVKTILLVLTGYFLVHKPLKLKLSSKVNVSWGAKLSLVWLVILADIFYLTASGFGISQAPQMIPQALIIALGAGFMEEYIFRGLMIQTVLSNGISSSKQVWGTVLLASLFFGLAHLGNLFYQPLDATLYQVYYALVIGIYFSAITIRTGSLWWTIILHFLIDFASILISQGTQATAATSIWSFVFWLPLVAISIFLLRPKKIAELSLKKG